MKLPNGRYHLEVKDHLYRIHPTENFILRLLHEPKFHRSQNQVQNTTQIRKKKKVFENINDELFVRNYPETKQPTQQQPKFNPPKCPSCKRINWLVFDKGYHCKICECNINIR